MAGLDFYLFSRCCSQLELNTILVRSRALCCFLHRDAPVRRGDIMVSQVPEDVLHHILGTLLHSRRGRLFFELCYHRFAAAICCSNPFRKADIHCHVDVE